MKNLQLQKPQVFFQTSVEDPVINVPHTFTANPWTCDPALAFSWSVDGVGVSTPQNGVLTHAFNSAGWHRVKLTGTSSIYGTSEIEFGFCVRYEYSGGTVGYTVTDAAGQPAGLTLDCNSGPRHINLTFSNPLNLPPGCELVVEWSRNGQPYSTGAQLTVYAGAPTDVYVGTVKLSCLGYKECVMMYQPGFQATVTVTVTTVFNPNCQ
jgi:hypothetical protein